ncbi:MAG: Uma2 family endonuclease [Sphingomonas sp.]|uniref:Uma2 family endonuclease n=1 Tax=Sphingomonas sp. TaxID=28214 RepID=UPI0035A8E1ED|nr:Uma2 family endonuclease [Sphingomonas sp.]
MTEMAPLNTAPLPVKLRIEDYLLLDASGAFEAYRKTELIDGEITFMNAQHRPHARIKSRLHVAIASALLQLDNGLEAIVEGSVAMPPDGAPEPDIVVTSEPEGEGLIPLESVRLIVEVSDTTLAYDTEIKRALYARNGVPEYWVANVEAKVIRQMWAPEGEAYAQACEVAFGERIEAATVAGLAVELPSA